jgi:thiamine pyrophosphate-dependent acetolactate synthase large subunit-like protein
MTPTSCVAAWPGFRRRKAGCDGGHDELVAIAEQLKAPVVHAMRGRRAAS